MTMMVEDFAAYLQGNAGLNALVAGRVYAQNLAQKATLPAVVYKQISGVRPSTMEGATGLNDGRYQFTAYALDYKTAKQVSQALRQALNRVTGTIGSTVTLDTALLSERDYWDFVTLEYRVELDFQIWHREP